MKSVIRIVAAVGVLGLAAGAWALEPPEQYRVWGARAKAHPYLADPGLDEPAPVAAPASDEEKARGFIFFSKPPAFLIRPDHVPAADERSPRLAARDCPGQYGPIEFAVLALKGGEYTVEWTGLTSAAGRKIPPEHLEVRVVRYAKVAGPKGAEVVPLLLESMLKKNVPAGRVQPFWITYHVPEGAEPGTYEGKVLVRLDNEVKLTIPLALTVYGFTLAEPDANLYIYYNNIPEPAYLPVAARELADQRCHGMTLASLEMPVTRAGELTAAGAAPWLDLYKKIGFARPYVHTGLWNRITAEWLNTPDKSIAMWGPWFRFYPFSEKLDRRFADAVKILRDEAKARGLALMLAVADEPGSHAWTTEAAQHYNDLVKAEAPDVLRELTVGGGWAMKRPEDELWKGRINIWTTNRWLPDKLDLVRAGDPKALVQVYNMAGEGSAGGGIESVRAFYGFFLWKSRAAGAAQWVYYHAGTPPNNYTWPAEDPAQGHVPTLRWEMAREGAKDLRYLATLEKLLAGKTGPAAEAARKFLDEIAGKIVLRTDAYDPIGGGRVPVQPPGTYDEWRGRIAELIAPLSAPK
jgi:hypothetical protein